MIKAFYSDPHFGHKNIIKYANRPFRDVQHMNEELVVRYNAVIEPTDTVMWLGDCMFCSTNKFNDYLNRLNGRKILVLGNHDKSHGTMSGIGFDLVMDECFMTIAGKTCRLKHYPYIDCEPQEVQRRDDRFKDRRPPRVKGEVLIHGHTHSSERLFRNMVHVGCDAWNCAPALMTDVEELIRNINV